MTENERTYTFWMNSTYGKRQITEDELDELKAEFRAYLLKWLWMREIAWENGWVDEPTLKHSSLRVRCNGYRDEARPIAFQAAMEWATQRGYIKQISLTFENQTGPNPVLYALTHAGKAWIIHHNNQHLEEHGAPFLYKPTKEQFINERGEDKDWTPQKRAPAKKAAKKAAPKKAAKKTTARKKSAAKKATRRKQ